MDAEIKASLWHQFGAAIDMLDNAIVACPEAVWSERGGEPEFWYLAYHTMFWLDYYLSESLADFAPPEPFGLEEMDPAGVLPPRVYTQAELRAYLAHTRRKCRTRIEGLTDETARARFRQRWMDFSAVELLLYNLRHVQHGAGQLNLLLRQRVNDAPRWVRQAAE